MAVVAHALLTSVCVVAGSLSTLDSRWSTMSDERREELLALAREQIGVVEGLLRDLLAGVPPEVAESLGQLGRAPDGG